MTQELEKNLTESKDSNHDEIRDLLKKNQEMTAEIYKMVKKINNFIVFQQVMSVLKILIIIVPVIIGIMYLPPLLKDVFEQYQSLLGGVESVNQNIEGAKNVDPSDLLNLIK